MWDRQFVESLVEISNPNSGSTSAEFVEVCGSVDSFAKDDSFILMGHCVVSSYVDQSAFTKKIQTGYENCASHSCVFAGCVKNNVPKLILVDNAISYVNQEVDDSQPTLQAEDPRFPGNVRSGGRITKKHIADKTGRYVKFIEMLLLVKNDQPNNYNFIITRATFTEDDGTPNISLKFKTLLRDSNVILPDRIITTDPFQPTDQLGGFNAKYLKYKNKCNVLEQII